jgi:hypothetical protein
MDLAMTDERHDCNVYKFGYELNGEKKQIDSKMVCLGDDQTYTAMAKQWDYLLQ